MTVSLQVAARAYAESGWAVFPLRPRDKKPLAKTNGFYDATTDTKQVEQWWAAKPACNIGIRTGEASNICVIDIDGEEGESEWRAILGDNPEPGTLTNKTGSGGRHLIFQHPGTKIGNQNLSAKINVRADGGYIVAPPSIHPSGKAYEWANPDAKIEPLPDWLLDALNARGNKPERAAPPSDDLVAIIAPPIPSATKATIRYGEEALTREINAVRTAPNGDRNNQLNKSTFALAQLAASGVLDAYTVTDQLLSAAVANGLPEGEARKTIASGLKSGIQQPRDLSHVGQRQSINDMIEEALRKDPRDYDDTTFIQTLSEPDAKKTTTQDIAKLLRDAIRNDAGNADCLLAMYGHRMRFCHTRNAWLIWDGSRWALDRTGMAQRLARKVAQARSKAASDIPTDNKDAIMDKQKLFAFAIASEASTVVERTLKSASTLEELATTIDLYDADPFLVNAGNVTIDLKTCTPRENRQSDYITKRLGAKYDPQAYCPRWVQFLNEIFDNKNELIAYMQRVIGHMLTGDISEQKLFLLHGGGSNGKSLFLAILAALMGEYGGNTPFETFDAESAEARQDLAKLAGTRLVTVVETDEDKRLAEARVKLLTGGDRVTARELYAKSFDYIPTYKIFIAMNHKPTIRGIDRGIWRRVKLIPFSQNFEGREEKGLQGKLLAELPGILNWALEGLKAWHIQGVGKCSAVDSATEEYRQESDIVGQWLADRTVKAPGARMDAAEAYQDFSVWKGGATKFENKQWFGRRMTDHGFKSIKLSGKRIYEGIGLEFVGK